MHEAREVVLLAGVGIVVFEARNQSLWLVLKDGSCRAGSARARRASGFKVSGRAGTNYFRAGPYRAYRLK
jgi:hypothetical protein